jgi:BirA family biotin operon repressor/biotin-[acetyl-CoA-carboxylase] ligase
MTIPLDLAPEKIRAALRSRLIGRPLVVLGEVGSTNDHIMAAGRAGSPEGLAVLADRQTAGRGRLGRAWASPPGVGVYTSILLRPRQPARHSPLLTLVAGLTVADAIAGITGLAPRLKWPNDVLVDGRKVAGILTEMASLDAWVGYVVIGIGINVNHGAGDFPEDLRLAATSLLLAAARPIPRGDVAAEVYNGLDRWYQVFCEGRFEAILAGGRDRSATLGQPVEVLGGEGGWEGLAEDLDADGALLVREEGGGLRRVLASDVSIRTTFDGGL